MTEPATLIGWAADLGLRARELPENRGIAVTSPSDRAITLTVARAGPGRWEIVSERSIVLPQPPQSADGHVLVRAADLAPLVHDLACMLPVVRAETVERSGAVDVTVSAALFDAGLSQQAFAVTMSSVLKTIEGCDRLGAKLGELHAAAAEARGAIHEELEIDRARMFGAADDLARSTAVPSDTSTAPMESSGPETMPTPAMANASSAGEADERSVGLPAGEFWFYVDSEQRLESGGEGSQPVALLEPGNWYRALRADGAVVRATDEHGNEGWVAADAVRPA